MKSRKFVAVPILFLLLLTGCSIERSLKLDTRLPAPPAVRQMPLRIGVYYSPEFADYTKKIELIGCGPSGRRDRYGIFFIFPVGAASRDLFDQVVASMFVTVIKASDLSQLLSDSSLDGLLELRIESFDWEMVCSNDYFSTGKFTANIDYVIDLYNLQGHLVASMPVQGSGAENPRLCFIDCKDSRAAEQAIQDAMARFMVEFNEQPEVRQWLLSHKVIHGNF